MQFAILGPVAASRDGEPIPLGGPKQRALLAILLLDANAVVSRDRLIDELWGEHPPPSVGQTLDSYVSRLRKLLGPDRLPRRAAGYALRVEPGELDLDRFETLQAEARSAAVAGKLERAAGFLTEALALWRGVALGDLLYESFAQRRAAQLEERRLAAVEQLMELQLALGQDAELVTELERLVREHPLRERLVGQLMLALYRAGRQADALACLQEARRYLAVELGLEPGPQLRELEQRILRHDPGLAAPRPPARQRRPAARFRIGAAASLVALVALVAGGLVLWSDSEHTARLRTAATSQLVSLEVRSGRIGRLVALSGLPAAASFGAGSVWVANASAGTVSRVDPHLDAVVDRIPVGGDPGDVVSGGGSIWVASTLQSTVTRIDPATETIIQTIHLNGTNPVGLAFGAGGLWVVDSAEQALIELDPASGSVRRTFSLDLRPSSVAVGAGELWVAGFDTGTVEEIDPASGQTIYTLPVGNGPAALAFGDGALWVANSVDSTVSRIDPETVSVAATIPVGSGPSDLVVAGGSVWVANQYSGTVSRINPRRNAVVATAQVGGQPDAIAASGATVWVAAGPNAGDHRGGTLVLASSEGTSTVDPAVYAVAAAPQFTGLAYDTLVTFAEESGPAGLHLVPDLALQVPTPTAGGTTYTFRLRPGIRYSDGRPLRASDFRRSLERLFRVTDSVGVDDYTSIIGAVACLRHPPGCNLARGVVTNDQTGTIVFHLSQPDPDFLYELADFAFSAPLPPGVPDHDAGDKPLPGTGPYRIATANAHEVVFVRNPFFREWSHAAQPSGNPNRIVWRFTSSHQQSIDLVETGRADWTWDIPPPAEIGALRARFPAQLHSLPLLAVEFLAINTHLPPFNNIRVRQALNYAINRQTIAQMYGGPFAAAPTCQPLVPGLSGYRRYCPYTRQPTPDGAYQGPNLIRARELVAESRTRGERITILGATDTLTQPHQENTYIASVLRSLGYRVELHLVPFASLTNAIQRQAQIITDGDWLPDYPAASSYIPSMFGCDGDHSNGYVCNQPLDKEMSAALALQLDNPAQAAALWTRIDHQITNDAYWVPTVTARYIDFISARVHNYQFNPVWGFIADQAWIK